MEKKGLTKFNNDSIRCYYNVKEKRNYWCVLDVIKALCDVSYKDARGIYYSIKKKLFIKSKYHVEKNDKNKKVWKDEVVCTKDIINIIEVLPGKKSYIFLKFLFKVFDEALVSKIEILDPKEKSVFGEDEVFKCCVFRNKMNL